MSHNEKKVVVVAGAMGYLGKAIVREFDKQGYTVALIYLSTSIEDVNGFLEELHHAHHKAYQCDISHVLDFQKVWKSVEEELGFPVCAIDASGKEPIRKKIIDVSFNDVENYINASFESSYVFLTESAKFFKEKRSGIIVGITTVGVIKQEAVKSMGAYIISKFATQGLLTLLHEELHEYGVSVFSVAPGLLPGGLNSSFPKAFFDIFLSRSETKKMATAEDVASVISTLCIQKDKNRKLTIPVAFEYIL